MRSAWKSDPGLVRENNEDAVRVDEEKGVFLLADGMGGGPGGEVASELAVTTAYQSLLRHLPYYQRDRIPWLLAQALAAAHSAIAKRAVADPALEGMGTTLEILLVEGAELFVCHLGDSRVYLFRAGALRQLTTDDNYAAVLAAAGEYSRDVLARYRHVLTQAVGLYDELVPEIHRVGLYWGDLLLVCSDGLTEVLSDAEIAALMSHQVAELRELTDAMVAAAVLQGARDNVSVIVIQPLAAASGQSLLLPSPLQ